MPWLPRLAAVLAHRRWPWVAALVGVLLASPALGGGLWLDDHLHRFVVGLHAKGEALGPWWDLYSAAEGDPVLTRARMEVGFSPWWTLPELRLRFLRPISAATHYVEYAAWPDAAWAMHAQSLGWYAGLVVAVGALLRRFLGATWVAGLATLLYAIDDAHAVPVGWIAQRNALVSAVLVVLVLLVHDRARRDRWRTGAWLGPLVLGLALAAGEASVAALGYLAAHALLLEPALLRPRGQEATPWAARAWPAVLALWPYAAVVIAWRLVYDALGYGAEGSGVYLDPGREPWAFAAALPDRIAALGLSQLAWPAADAWTVAPPPWGRARALAVAGLVLVALVPRLRRDRGLAACVLGSALALVPAAAVVPSDRMLLLVGVGASAAVAGSIAEALGEGGRGRGLARSTAIVLALPLVVIHAVLAPLALPRAIAGLRPELEEHQRAVVASLPDDPALAGQHLVIVNAPPTFVSSTLWLWRWGDPEHALPRSLRVLGATLEPVIVQRPDERTLVLQPVGGYLGDPFTANARGRAHPFAAGDVVELTGWTVAIEGVAHGRPTAVRIRFDVPLHDPSLRWVVWRGDRFVPFEPPVPGRSLALPGGPSVASAGSAAD
jgi:hypothetical protein